MILNYLKVKHKDSLLKLLKKHEKCMKEPKVNL